MSIIIACNAGSSNTKLAAFNSETLEPVGHLVSEHIAEVIEWLCAIGSKHIVAIAHRAVHGGREFTAPVLLDDGVCAKLAALVPLAPLHQPAALRLIEQTRKLYPGVPQLACFDTAFHHTIHAAQRRFPIARSFYDAGIMRYGFHGLSYQHIADVLPSHTDKADQRVVVAHLGGGSSACAMKNRQSVASTMGFSTLDGMMMGTRSGALDPGIILHWLGENRLSASEITELLYHQSGLKGVSGMSGDMRALLASSHPHAKEAVELYCASAARQIANLLPALGGLDVLVFTGGIGENATSVRDRITAQLQWAGEFAVKVIATDEEKVMAQACKPYVKANL